MATLFVLVLLLSTGSVLTFADTVEKEIENPFTKPELTEMEKQQARYDKMVELLDTYLPERSEEWINGYEEHEAIHEDLEAIKAEIELAKVNIKDVRALLKAKIQDLKAQIQAGEITREEATTAFDEFKAPYEALKVDMNALRVSFKETLAIGQANKEERQAAKATLIKAIKAGETEIAPLLDTLVDLQFVHLDFDYSKLALQNQRLEILNSIK